MDDTYHKLVLANPATRPET